MKYNLRWSGTLTPENCTDVTVLFSQMLAGHTYTSVTVNEGYNYEPEVRTDQRLVNRSQTDGPFNINDSGFGFLDSRIASTTF